MKLTKQQQSVMDRILYFLESTYKKCLREE